MSLTANFTVHATQIVPVRAIVSYNGQEVSAVVDACEVQLVGAAKHGSLTLTFTGVNCKEAQAKFKVGEVVTWSI